MGVAEGFQTGFNIAAKREELRMNAANQNAKLYEAGFDANGNPIAGGIAETQQDITKQQLALIQQQVQSQQNIIDSKDSALHFANSVETGDFTTAQSFLDSNPRVANLWKSQGVHRVDNINFDKDSGLLASAGLTTEQINNPEARAKLGKTFFKVQSEDGNWSLRSADDVVKQTNMRNNLAASQWENINSIFKDAKTALQPSGEDTLSKFTTSYKHLYPNATADQVIEAYKADLVSQKAGKGMEPFSIQEARYVADLQTKVDADKATKQEIAELEAYRANAANSCYKTNVAIKGDTNKFETKYNVNLATDDLSALPVSAKNELNRMIQDLENTPSGREVTKLVSKDIEGGLGAVMSTAVKLNNLVSKEGVKTSVIKNQWDSIKELMPESWRDVDDEDLNNTEFRKAFLSASSAFLKLQSGLTVSDAERSNFEASFGTLNRNPKSNMQGLKTKFDEVRNNFQTIRQLNPELYNMKYAAADRQLNNISGILDNYISPSSGKQRVSSTSGSATPGGYTPKDRLLPPPTLVFPGSQTTQSGKQRRPLSDFKLH